MISRANTPRTFRLGGGNNKSHSCDDCSKLYKRKLCSEHLDNLLSEYFEQGRAYQRKLDNTIRSGE